MTFTGKNLLLYAVGGADGVHSGRMKETSRKSAKSQETGSSLAFGHTMLKRLLPLKNRGLITWVL